MNDNRTTIPQDQDVMLHNWQMENDPQYAQKAKQQAWLDQTMSQNAMQEQSAMLLPLGFKVASTTSAYAKSLKNLPAGKALGGVDDLARRDILTGNAQKIANNSNMKGAINRNFQKSDFSDAMIINARGAQDAKMLGRFNTRNDLAYQGMQRNQTINQGLEANAWRNSKLAKELGAKYDK